MGYIKHNAIIVTDKSFDNGIKELREKAIELELPCSEIINSGCNGFKSFFIAPDGSKEGWNRSNIMDEKRKEFKKYCHGFDVVEIEYGADLEKEEYRILK